jgi:Protein of unknown function (DUF4199)
MFRIIVVYGIIGGLIVAAPMVLGMVLWPHDKPFEDGAVVGYITMIVALSTVFLGVKHHRDRRLGGVIKFVPAFLIGVGISAVAGVLYVAGWDLALGLTHFDFAAVYSKSMIEAAQANGASAAELEKLRADMAALTANYANPLYRWPVTFIEIFPVGVIISLISAALLRNSRFLPAQARAA